MTSSFLARFAGVGRLYGRAGLERLANAHVAVIGLGGVGSWAVEALARSGIGTLTLVDMDDVCISNTNRQLHALEGNGGRPKAEVLRERVLAINPECRAHAIPRFFTTTTAADILATRFDFVVDAIDSLKDKCHLLVECRARAIPVVTSGGCAGKRDGTAIRITDLSQSGADNLLRIVRRKLRREHGFPRAGKKFGIPCVWSEEIAAGMPTESCEAAGTTCDDAEPKFRAPAVAPGVSQHSDTTSRSGIPGAELSGTTMRPNCEWGHGTAVFVSGAFGFAAASVVVSQLAQNNP